jgi:hypothetical protein
LQVKPFAAARARNRTMRGMRPLVSLSNLRFTPLGSPRRQVNARQQVHNHRRWRASDGRSVGTVASL